jgi:hypothetical protein
MTVCDGCSQSLDFSDLSHIIFAFASEGYARDFASRNGLLGR